MRKTYPWTTPEDIAAQVRRMWERGEILSALVSGYALFPKRLTLKVPTATEMRDRFGEVRDWIREIGATPCCRIETRSFRHRVHGANSLPHEIWVDTPEFALKLIGKQGDASRFLRLVETTRRLQPLLLDWVQRHPHRALAHCENWERLLAVVGWLRDHPRPGIYPRQVDLPGVHSKFLEAHRGILAELFDIVLPAEAIDFAVSGASQFERRYGFLGKPLRIRFRILDPSLTVVRGAAMPDISLDAESFARLDPRVARVFITENEVNYLAFPRVEKSLVLFGAGYGFQMLRDVEWLSRCSVYYWGDIDTHGFAILDQLRCLLGGVQSFLMDRDTLFRFERQWGREGNRAARDLPRLTGDERALYDDLRFDRIRENLRLEQEKIGFHWVEAAIRALL